MNAFEKMATPKTESKKSSVNKIAAAVTDAIKIAVDKVIDLKGKLKSLEAEQAQAEEAIISHVKPQYRKAGKEGNFTKTFVVQGNVGALNFTATDRFSVPQDQEALDEIEKAVNKKRYGEWFLPEFTVSVKASVIQNDALVAKIMKDWKMPASRTSSSPPRRL
jgi:hypothetical protein